MTRHPARVSVLAAAVAIALMPVTARAQLELEEIIVTAQKRTESLQDVPISLSAIQGETIKEAGIQDMVKLAAYVPNLHIDNAAINTNIYMRGVGSGNNQGFEQSVGMYIDGIYMGRGHQYRTGFLDLERVEVLRGPQGTLFGRNTVAGAVNIVTASPTPGDATSGELALNAEENGGYGAEGFISGSLTDTLAARFAMKYRESDGYVDNTFLDRDEPENESTTYRVTLAWQPTADLDVNFKYSHADEDITGAPSSTWLFLDAAERAEQVPRRSAFASIAYNIMDRFYPGFKDYAADEWTTFKDGGYGNDGQLEIGRYPDSNDSEVDNYVLNVDYQIGDYTLTSVTGQSGYEFQAGADVDWLPLQFIHRDDDQEFDQFSQELRFASPGGQFFDFMVGAYYDKSTVDIDRLVVLDLNMDDLVPQALGGLNSLFTVLTGGQYNVEQIARNHHYELDSESWAGFAQGTFNFTEDLRLTLGVRYTKEDKDVESVQFLADDILGYDVPSDNYYLHRIQATSFNAYEYNYKTDRSTDDLIPSVNLQWDVGDESMLYVSFSQGFKSGGFTDADDGEPGDLAIGTYPCVPGQPIESCYDLTNPNEDFEFDDESVDAFEIGGKHTLLDGAMTFNWAAFYTEYDNLQTAIFKGIGFTTTNAGSSEIMGIELDTRWAATENLIVGISAAWLDATYDEFADAPCTALQLDADPLCGTPGGVSNNDQSGEPTLYASDYSASLIWDYTYPLGGMDLFAGGEVNYRDDFNSAGDADPIDLIEAYTLVNLRLGVRAESWEVMAYGRNVFDEEYFSQSFDTPVLAGSHSRFMQEGAVFGVRGKYMF
jgi:outer membrane receptor protein involved in Fe transport